MRCKSRKRRYPTQADAMLALLRIQEQRDIDNMDKHERCWYPCSETPSCDGFHLTSWSTTDGPR